MTSDTIDRRVRIALAAAVGVLLFLCGITPHLDPISAGLDPSWHAVLAWALRHQIQWGRDIYFTYGPLGILSPTAVFDPHVYWLSQALTGVMAVTLAALASHAVWRIPAPYGAAFLVGAFILCANWAHTVGWLLSYPFALLALRYGMRLRRIRAITLTAWLAFFAAQLPLIKFVSFPLWIVFVPVGCAVLWKQRILFGVFLAVSIVAPLITWIAFGQASSNYPAFISSSMELATYYAQAMQLRVMPAFSDPLALATLLATLAGLAAITLQRHEPAGTTALAALTAATLCLAYRAALIRADAHIFTFWATASLAPLIAVGYAAKDRWTHAQHWIAAATLLIVPLGLMSTIAFTPIGASALSAMLQPGLPLKRLTQLADLPAQYRQGLSANQQARTALALPQIAREIGKDPVDLMMNSQGTLLANDLNYRPRPVFQGYLAYSKKLLRANDRFMQSAYAAPWMIVQFGTINEKYPNSDDAWTLLRVLQDFQPILNENGYLLFRRAARTTQAVDSAQDGVAISIAPGDTTTIPKLSGNAVFARLDVRLTLAGRLESWLFRDPTLWIDVSTRDGRHDRFRLVRSVASSGFLLSPALRDNGDYLQWLQVNDGREVTEITIVPNTFLGMRTFHVAEPLELAPRSLRRQAPDFVRQTRSLPPPAQVH